MASRYYVEIPVDDALHGAFTRLNAQHFARIGSAHGTMRRVWRRKGDGWVLVREYVDGHRAYPETLDDCDDLTPSEIPARWR